MDLKIIQEADIDTDMGRVKSVSYTALSLLFLFASRAKDKVMINVIGTFTAAIVRVCFSAGIKSLREYVYLKFSSPANPFITPFELTLLKAFTTVLIKGKYTKRIEKNTMGRRRKNTLLLYLLFLLMLFLLLIFFSI